MLTFTTTRDESTKHASSHDTERYVLERRDVVEAIDILRQDSLTAPQSAPPHHPTFAESSCRG